MTQILQRFAAWHIRTYGRWATEHEPYSFAIYPLLAALGPLLWWLVIGPTAALVLLAFMEGLAIFFLGSMLYRRRKRRFTSRER